MISLLEYDLIYYPADCLRECVEMEEGVYKPSMNDKEKFIALHDLCEYELFEQMDGYDWPEDDAGGSIVFMNDDVPVITILVSMLHNIYGKGFGPIDDCLARYERGMEYEDFIF